MFENVKMICSDLDGTILTYDQTELSDRLIAQIRELKKMGIWFVPTSGRSIPSMQKLFAPVLDCCYFIGSNGAVVFDSKGEVLGKTLIPKEKAMEIAHDFLDRTNDRGEVNISGPRCSHLLPKGLGMVERIQFIGNQYEIHEKPEDVEDEIVKVAVYLPDGAQNYIDQFEEKWKDYNASISGPYWIDATLADKGKGVRMMAELLQVDLKDIVAFGDNFNDVQMLDTVGMPYIMSTAAPELLDRYEKHTASVEDTIEEILSILAKRR